MPVFEQKQPFNRTQEKQPQAAHRTSLPRLSNIPRPVKQLVVETNGGSSHASKPTLDKLPLQTPSKNLDRTRIITKDDNSKAKLPDTDSEAELAILELVPFSRQPMVNFGDVKLGTTKIRYVMLRNSLNVQQQLFVKSFPKADKGFYMDATEFFIAPNTEICVALAWTPKMVGGIRESITLQDVNRMPKRIVLMGTAIRPKPEPSLSKSNRNIPRLFRRSPNKMINKQIRQERNKLVFSPRSSRVKQDDKPVKPLTKLLSPSPEKRHRLVRKLLSQYDGQMATRVQSYFRMVLEKRRLASRKAALVKIQAYCRMIIEQRRYKQHKTAIIRLQSYWRMLSVRRQFEKQRAAIVKIQSYSRMLVAKRQFANRKAAILRLQSYCRMIIERRRYKAKRLAIVKMQSYCRMVLERRRFETQRAAIIRIQSFSRMLIARRRFENRKAALLRLQSYWRMIRAKKQAARRRAAIVKIQSFYRMTRDRRSYQKHLAAVVKMQSYARMILERRRFESQRSAIIKIQSCFRMVLEKRRFVQLKAAREKAAIVLQKHCRAMIARHELARLKRLNLLVLWFQSRSRGYLHRRKFKCSIEAVLRIQKRFCDKDGLSSKLL